MILRIMILSLMIFQLNSAMENGLPKEMSQQERKPIPESELDKFRNEQIEYQLSQGGCYRKGTFGGRVSKERFSIVYTNQARGITVSNDKIYRDPSQYDTKK
jgi:hypothetical protein